MECRENSTSRSYKQGCRFFCVISKYRNNSRSGQVWKKNALDTGGKKDPQNKNSYPENELFFPPKWTQYTRLTVPVLMTEKISTGTKLFFCCTWWAKSVLHSNALHPQDPIKLDLDFPVREKLEQRLRLRLCVSWQRWIQWKTDYSWSRRITSWVIVLDASNSLVIQVCASPFFFF